VATTSAAEQHVVGWPLPARLVARTDSMRRRVAMFLRVGIEGDTPAGKATSEVLESTIGLGSGRLAERDRARASSGRPARASVRQDACARAVDGGPL